MNSPEHPRTLSCEEVHDLAPEMGPGVIGGGERADVLAHLDTCPACRSLVDDMAAVGDSLLTLAPRVEPPTGFASRVLARPPARPRTTRSRRRPVLAVAAGAVAAAVAAVVAVGVGVGFGDGGHGGFQVSRPAAIAALGGRQLAAAPLTGHGHARGQVFVYAGHPSWVFMTVDFDGPARQLTCQLLTQSGATVVLGHFTVSNGYGAWGSTIRVDPASIRTVRLVDTQGATAAVATLPR